MRVMTTNGAVDEATSVATTSSHAARKHADASYHLATESGRKIHLLVLSSLYPNAAQPRHGVFVEERLRHLVDSGQVSATVVAPVPWFPFQNSVFGAYAKFASVPEKEERYGIKILHPRYPVIPKLGMNVAPFFMSRALLPVLRKLKREGTRFDLIDAHYFYPDGVAAAHLGEALDQPVVITARGSDVTFIPSYPRCRRKIQWAARSAAAIVTVSQSLKSALVALNVDPGKITVLRNGVDLDRFEPRNRSEIRARLGLHGPVWLTVGNLIELKGVDIVIEALAQLPNVTLLIAGDGPQEPMLRRQVERLGLATRAHFLGAIAQAELCNFYNAADALVLASSREGMPNVVLEALACGTPVVATRVGGVPELITAQEAGELMRERAPDALVEAWTKLQARKIERAATRKFAERLGWQSVVEAQCALYARLLSARVDSLAAGAAT